MNANCPGPLGMSRPLRSAIYRRNAPASRSGSSRPSLSIAVVSHRSTSSSEATSSCWTVVPPGSKGTGGEERRICISQPTSANQRFICSRDASYAGKLRYRWMVSRYASTILS